MFRFAFIALAAPLLLLCAETPASPEKGKTPAPAPRQTTSGATPAAIGTAGMVVVKDPESGELRAPNAKEAATLNLGGASAGAGLRVSNPLVEFRSPVGQVPGIRLNDSFNVYSVATIGPDGKVKMDCVDDKSKAESAAKTGAKAKPVLTVRKEAQLELQ